MNARRSAIVFFSLLFAAGGVHAQIAYRAAASAVSASGSAAPAFQAAGAAVTGTGNVTPAWPAHAIGDVALLFVESTGGQAANLSVPAGFAAVANSPQSTGAGTAGTRITVYWARATSTTMATPTVMDPGDHVYARILTYRGVIATGNPWDITGGGVKAAASTAVSVTGVTTNVPNTLVVQAVARDNDSAAAAFSAQANGNLTGITERSDAGTTSGNGGGFAVWEGVKATPGATGNTTATVTNSINAFLTVALRPPNSVLTINVPGGTVANDVMIASITYRPCSNVDLAACTTTIAPPAGWTPVNTVTDQTTGGGTGGYGNRLFVYRRVVPAVPPEPASYTWTFGGQLVHAGAAGGITSFSGVDNITPIDAQFGNTTPSAVAHTASGVTPTVANTMLVTSFTANSSAAWTNPALPIVERVDAASLPVTNDLGDSMQVNTEPYPGTVATGPRTGGWTAPPAADAGITHMLALRPVVTVNHYAISVLSTSVANCDAAEVTITAHNAAHAAVNPPATRIVTLATSVGTGVWQPTLVTGTGAWTPSGLDNGAATYQWPGGESSFTVRLRQSAVTALSVNLSDGFVIEDAGEDPTISFADLALRISNGANAALAIGSQIALKPSNTGVGSQTLFLQAIRTDTATGACISLFPNGSEVDFEVGAQCNNPAACTQNVTLTTTSGSGSPTGNFVPNGAYPSTIRFRFTTANAEAPFFFRYADAGQITLQFRSLLPGPPAGVYVSGTSNAFVTRPFGFAFRGANDATPIQHGTLPTSALLAAAGDNFTMTVAAYRWAAAEDDGTGNPLPGADITDNGLTPNFASATTVSATGNLPGVASGAVSRGVGCVGAGTIAAGSWSGGAATIGDWCYSEAGNAFFGAAAADYIAAGVNVSGNSGLDGTGAAGGYVGRFKPKRFSLVGTPAFTPRYVAGCGGSTFTYMGEGIKLDAFTMEAINTLGNRTQNYHGAYARHDPNPGLGGAKAGFDVAARSGTTNYTTRVAASHISVPAWSQGHLTVGGNPLEVVLSLDRLPANTPDGPFPATGFGIAPLDPDNVRLPIYDLDVDNNAANDHLRVGTTDIRFGRLFMQNAYGSGGNILPVPLQLQYWSGSNFVVNADDSCTTLNRSQIAMDFTPVSNLTACETAVNAGTVPFTSGVGTLILSAPGTTNDGSVLLTANLNSAAGLFCNPASYVAATNASKAYLLGRWDSGAAYDDKPSARAAFGIYGQPRNFIFFRENY